MIFLPFHGLETRFSFTRTARLRWGRDRRLFCWVIAETTPTKAEKNTASVTAPGPTTVFQPARRDIAPMRQSPVRFRQIRQRLPV